MMSEQKHEIWERSINRTSDVIRCSVCKCGIDKLDDAYEVGSKDTYCERCYLEKARLHYAEVLNGVNWMIDNVSSYLNGYVRCFRDIAPKDRVGFSVFDIDLVLQLQCWEVRESYHFIATAYATDANGNPICSKIERTYDANSMCLIDFSPRNIRFFSEKASGYSDIVARFHDRMNYSLRKKDVVIHSCLGVCKCCGLAKIIFNNLTCQDCIEEQKRLDRLAAIDAEQKRKEDEKEAKRLANKNAGYVYLIVSQDGRCKIGFTRNLKSRLGKFRNVLPGIEYHHVLMTDDMRRKEKELHAMFEDKRIGGEWFNLTQSDIDYIKSL